MPKSTKSTKSGRSHTRNHTKRLGKHHKKSGRYVKVYAPYLPLIISIIASMFLSFWQPNNSSTLAYATSMSAGGLLSATNTQRSSNGKSSLTLNSKLSSAAQAKANHMVTHNYWSHTTPDGQEPWVFIQNAGYAYNKAGENLAYGFATSPDAVIGWMNSATHKANMLDGSFTEVGFGYANSANFNGDGNQTVVVAMYGQPQVLAASAAPAAAATPAPPTTPQPATQPASAEEKPKPVANTKADEKPQKNTTPVTTEQPVSVAAPISQDIAKAQTLTSGNAPWALGAAAFITGLAIIVLLVRHSLKVRHIIHDLIHDTQRFVLHHPLLDSTLLGLALLGTVLSRSVGTIL